ncbi:NUDIX hydrolase [Methanoculleus taiwanensis]|uniref:NAD(+) diphosphatase n=1 Tax=Methanoculleus taiwanensis TaxID=1550565 RepID=A0A498GYU1_9EURY|nr:NAD(+) diphosphatase [Methanoculleus taiwanensis]RXE55841.1 NUDIX hydrolase [Methanoculleus taiwanensis]
MQHADTRIHTGAFSADALTVRYPAPEIPAEGDALFLLVRGSDICTVVGERPQVFLHADPATAGCRVERTLYLGHRAAIPCYAVEIAVESLLPEGMGACGVRALYGRVPEDDLAAAALAVRIIDFDRTTQYCGRCGAKTVPLTAERAKTCPACSLIVYPRLSPAIIVLVRDGERILLARSPHFPPGMYSIIAGFVEPGENLEHAVHREVREETGVSVRNVRYFGSEPWPFPDSLMIGFTADYAGGDLVADNREIEAAGWFERDNLPPLPSTMSISRALLDRWLHGEGRLDVYGEEE